MIENSLETKHDKEIEIYKGKNIAFIPLRAGSKRLPDKNVKEFLGHPLFWHTAITAWSTQAIDRVVVATNDKTIKKILEQYIYKYKKLCMEIEIYARKEENAKDDSSTESVMLEFFETRKCNKIVLLQATSPYIQINDVKECLRLSLQYDSVISVSEQPRFEWKEHNGLGVSLNYNPFARPRSQEAAPLLIENGAIYVTSWENLIINKCRISGRTKLYKMNKDAYLEIDDYTDFIALEAICSGESKNG